MTAHKFLERLKSLPRIIENSELEKQRWEDRAKNTTSGGVTIGIENKKTGEIETHNVEKVQSSSGGDSMAVAVVSYVDLERKIEALKAEKEWSENLLEQLEANQYDVLYKSFILDFRNYEIAYSLNKSISYIEKIKNKGLKNLQILLDSTENYGLLRNITEHIDF